MRSLTLSRRRATRSGWRADLFLLALLSPNLLLFAIFTWWPLLNQAYLSLTSWDFLSPVKPWVGLGNYLYLAQSPKFQAALLNTIVFTVAALVLMLSLGLALALLLNQRLRGRNFVRSLVFAPTIISGAAIGLVWIYVFDPRYGLIASLLALMGVRGPAWLSDPAWALPAIIIVYTWKNVGYAAIVYLAGLQSIPADLYEAARVDGAPPWRQFVHITWPLLGPTTLFISVTVVLGALGSLGIFQSFDIIAVMTRGGPVTATSTILWAYYEEGFIAFHAGRAAAISVLLFALMLGVTLIQLLILERRVHYQ